MEGASPSFLRQVCVNIPNTAMMITVPGPGTVIVETVLTVALLHVNGYNDTLQFFDETLPGQCFVDAWTSAVQVGANVPDARMEFVVTIHHAFAVTGGSYSYYVNVRADYATPSGNAWAIDTSSVAVFYPS